MSKNLIKQLQNFSFQEDLWQKGSRIVVGVSGGPDSSCLLDFFVKMQPKYNLELLIAHVNYGLREKDSERDEKLVRKLAEKYDLKIKVLKFSKAKFWKSQKLSVNKFPSENDLRDIRYAFFEKVRKDNAFDLIAVAHNQDDQVETFLLRLLRGAGLKGLSGMKAKNGRVIRPLLQTSRKEILAYLQESKLKFRTDKTNTANLFSRNKVRNRLLPFLEKEFNPAIKKTLAENIANIADDELFLQAEALKYFRKQWHLRVSKLLSLEKALQRRVLLLAIQNSKGDLENVDSAHLREILKALQSPKNKNQKVSFQGLNLIRKGDRVILS